MEKSVTVRAPVNIAVIKYWGKSDENQIFPINSSLSATLNMDQLCTTTTIASSPKFTQDSIVLNGKPDNIQSKRLQNCLSTIKSLALKHQTVPQSFISQKILITTSNNFPTAAGLASSASGFAALTFALAKLYNLDVNSKTTDLSQIARIGSGSACRSLSGGFVQWHKPNASLGVVSNATQVFEHTHWPELIILICIVNDKQKETSSTVGMRRSTDTSDLIVLRDLVTQKRIERITRAIKEKDLPAFAEVTMKDSNQFHAVCLDSYPPIKYMNETSWEVIKMVHKYNDSKNAVKVGYTFDAGPNAVLFLERKDFPDFLKCLLWFFPENNNNNKVAKEKTVYVQGGEKQLVEQVRKEQLQEVKMEGMKRQEGVLRSILVTSLGRGPEEVLVSQDGKGSKL